jgi:hypothetical protein
MHPHFRSSVGRNFIETRHRHHVRGRLYRRGAWLGRCPPSEDKP